MFTFTFTVRRRIRQLFLNIIPGTFFALFLYDFLCTLTKQVVLFPYTFSEFLHVHCMP